VAHRRRPPHDVIVQIDQDKSRRHPAGFPLRFANMKPGAKANRPGFMRNYQG
jgi:hypothetical protein